MKKVYLVHIYKNGLYHHTCSIAFSSRKADLKYAEDCMFFPSVEQVDLCSLSDF